MYVLTNIIVNVILNYFHTFVKLPNFSSHATSIELHVQISFRYTTP